MQFLSGLIAGVALGFGAAVAIAHTYGHRARERFALEAVQAVPIPLTLLRFAERWDDPPLVAADRRRRLAEQLRAWGQAVAAASLGGVS